MLKTLSTRACALVLLTGVSQATDELLKGNAAFGYWREDSAGVKRLLRPQDLLPVSTPTYAAASIASRPAGPRPLVPAGFSVQIVADGLTQSYGIAFYPPGLNPGWVYIANSDSVVRFRYRKGDLQ